MAIVSMAIVRMAIVRMAIVRMAIVSMACRPATTVVGAAVWRLLAPRQ